MAHPNSRKVTIYRKNSFLANAQEQTAPDFMRQAKKSIGSFWTTSHSKSIGSGLSFEEQQLLLPTIVDCEETDRQFRAKVTEFYQNIKTSVPFDKGVELEIGLRTSNTEPVSKTNMPIDLADYITYRHAKAHPLVAANKEEGEGSLLKEFYIFDPAETELKQMAYNKERDEAMEYYLLVKKEPVKVEQMLTLLGVDTRLIKGRDVEGLRAQRLKDIAMESPSKFMAVYKDKFFEEAYLLESLIREKILTRVGLSVLNLESGETIGHNTKEAIVWLMDPKKSEQVALFRLKLTEATGNKLSAAAKASGQSPVVTPQVTAEPAVTAEAPKTEEGNTENVSLNDI